MSLAQKTKQEVVTNIAAKLNTENKNTGLTEVQCTVMTRQIEYLTNHLATNKKDHSSKRALLITVSKRRRLLDYLKKKSLDRYSKIISELKIRK